MVSDVPEIGRNWWLFVVLGVICLVTGILTIVWPDITLLTLGIFAGIYLMVTAVLELIDAIFGEPGGRGLSAILGIISLIAGLVFLRRPGESLVAIVVVAGIFLVAEGVIRVVRAFSFTVDRWWGVGLGLIDVIVGAVILSWPGIGLVTLAVFFAVTMIVRGILAIVAGFKLRSLSHAQESSTSHSATYAT